jgi:predicted  nucleic acid-binding Zn-ribbon protein
VLRTFMSSQQDPSPALVEQFTILQQRQVHLMAELNRVTDHVQHLQAEYQHVTGQVTGAEQDRRNAQCEWDKISEQITRLSFQSASVARS